MKTLFIVFKYKIIGLISVLLIAPFLLFSQPTQDEIQQSINDGLVYLVTQQNPDGSWIDAYGSLEATTGLALYKLCERAYELGYESPFVEEYEYHQNVIDGFNWVFAHLTIHDIWAQDHTTGATGTMDDPDVNGNGTGVCAQFNTFRETYATGILLTGLAASGTPARVVNVAGSPVIGWLFADVVQDMVDFLAFGQVEYPVPGITEEGGWDYVHVDNGTGGSNWKGDQSNSGYAVLGLSVAQDFGAIIPAWVKTELSAWIDLVQDDVDDPVQANDGGSWYSFPQGDFIGVNTLKTGNLLSQMALVGDLPTTPRVLDAIDYLERHWGDASGANSPPGWDGDPAQYQAMFCLMKGLVFIGIDEFGIINWFDDFATAIVAQQYLPDPLDIEYGAWKESSGRGDPVLITEWALLILEKIAPIARPIACDFDVHPTSWPNPINTKSTGLTPTAILGTEVFDVMMIDIESLYLELPEGDVYPVKWAYEDVTQPAGSESDCNDTEGGPDGFMDLTLKFDTQELIAALGEVTDGEEVIIKIVGNLMDGDAIEGDDCIWIKQKTEKSAEIDNIVTVFELSNYPDPFHGTTTITFTLEETNNVTLKVYNTLGVEVATLYNGFANADQKYMLEFNGDMFSEGLYFYVLRNNETILGMNKMLMMK